MKTRRLNYLRVVALALLAGSAVPAGAAVRTISSFDRDWRFSKSETAGAETPDFADSTWQQLNVPHDWAIEGPFDAANPTRGSGAFAPSGVVWYRKTFTLPAADAGKRHFIDFGGVMAHSDVYINGFLLGNRPYGYSSFQYDLTGHLNFDGKPNVIAVRADTSKQPASRWYAGGGIYRHVRLETKDPVHIENWGTFVTTPKVGTDAATVHVRSTVINQSETAREVSVQVQIHGPDGKPVITAQTAAQSVPAGKSIDFDQDIIVNTPKVWDLQHTDMYTAVASVRAGANILDDQSVPFGIRSFEFKPDTGFWLNGKNFKLKGVCLHADAGGLGMAVPEDEWIHRLKSLQAIGANAVRTAHHPFSPEFYDACDKMGMLVMDETFDCWAIGKNTFDYHVDFEKWNLIDARDMVRRDRNHPSIVMYSAGNEIREPRQPARAKAILGPLMAVIHENDPTRPVTQAILQPNQDADGGSYKNGFADMLDIVGTNYRDDELLAAWRDKPTRKIVGTENNKDMNAWAKVRDIPAYSGSFIWTGVDYLGETFAFPNIGASAGVIEITDRPKGEAFQRASWWLEKPVVYIARAPAPAGPPGAGRGPNVTAPAVAQAPAEQGAPSIDPNPILPANPTTPEAEPAGNRGAATAPGARGAPAGRGARGPRAGGAGAGARGRGPSIDWTPTNLTPHPEIVNVYSNCDEVELFLNGQSLGTKPRGNIDSVRTWNVDFAAGTLKAVGKNKGDVAATHELATAGKPAKLVITASTDKLADDFDSLAHVTVAIVDEKGVPVPTAGDTVTFAITGPGAIAALENGSLTNQNFRGTEHAAFNGQVVAFVRATGSSGKITLKASAPNLGESTVSFDAASARPGH